MVREPEKEKQFSQDLDRILAGEEVTPESGSDAEMRSSLEFARKMKELQAAPTPQYQAQLKARLLQQLSAREARSEEQRNWVWRLMHQPIWQAAVVFFLVVLVGGVIFGGRLFQSGQAPVLAPAPTSAEKGSLPAAAQAPQAQAVSPPAAARPFASPSPSAAPNLAAGKGADLISADASANKATYQSGEDVNLTVTIHNNGTQSLVIEHFPPAVRVMDASARQPVYTFSAGSVVRTLEPDQAASFNLPWKQRDSHDQQVSAGSYYLELADIPVQGQDVRLTLSPPLQFTILPASPK